MNTAGCPSWCTDHKTTEYADATTEHHHASLFASWCGAGTWVFHLYVGAVDIDHGPYAPGTAPELALVENHGEDSVPRRLSPEQAREFAAALIRGAEIVEAGLTATCAKCGVAAHTRDLFDDDLCATCSIESRRTRLTLV